MKWLDSITNSLDMNLSNLCETVKDRGAWVLQSVRLQSVGQDFAKEQQNNNNYLEKKNTMVQFYSILVNSILYAFKMKNKSKLIHYFFFFRFKFCIGLFDLKRRMEKLASTTL